ncbi:protein-glutamine gamma-glutamyltransferase E-like [Lithobates pipiens]
MSNLFLTNTDFSKVRNATAHRTLDYDTSDMVLRRGQPFTMAFTFNRQITSRDELKIIVETGPSPSTQTNTRAEMLVSSSSSGTSWSAVRGSSSNNIINITVNIPVNASIGRYNMSVQTTSGGRPNVSRVGTFIVLFNPWATADEVYMSNEAEKTEYVLNETGLYWFGNVNSYGSRRWDYAQFERDILNITLTILDKSLDYKRNPATDVSRRNDPIYVGRVLSAMVNSNNDNGIVLGNWSGNYSGGVSPTTWNGSAAILRQWMQSGPVRFGQCWVYAGVLCTVLRCLGIPARVIINFQSAHDTDENLLVDEVYDENGVRDEYESQDSVWNFHAWNEAYLARKDLGPNYGGWQIFDATPQEPSQGIYRLGPTSLYAVKNGEVDKPYDGRFVFAEVNADTVTWVKSRDGSRRKVYTDTVSVGKLTSTKAVGIFERRDVTYDYKYPEGSDKEREVFEKARNIVEPPRLSAMSSRRSAFASTAADDSAPAKPLFSGSFKKAAETQVGEDLKLTLILKNTVTDPQKIKIKMTATAIIYNSKPVKDFLTESHSVSLGPNEEKPIEMKLPYVVYRDAITADNMIQVVAVCTDERGGNFLVQTVTTLKNPALLIRPIEEVKFDKTARVDCIFTNPIKEDVPDSILIVEGSGLLRDQIFVNVPCLKPNQRVTIQFEVTPHRKGDRCILADFSSKKFPNVKGFQTVPVASS